MSFKNMVANLKMSPKLVWKQVSLGKIELKDASKEEKMGIMSLDVNEMKNVCTTNLFVNVCCL